MEYFLRQLWIFLSMCHSTLEYWYSLGQYVQFFTLSPISAIRQLFSPKMSQYYPNILDDTSLLVVIDQLCFLSWKSYFWQTLSRSRWYKSSSQTRFSSLLTNLDKVCRQKFQSDRSRLKFTVDLFKSYTMLTLFTWKKIL